MFMSRGMSGGRALLHRRQMIGRRVCWRVVGGLRRMVIFIRTALIIHTPFLSEPLLLGDTASLGRVPSGDGIEKGA